MKKLYIRSISVLVGLGLLLTGYAVSLAQNVVPPTPADVCIFEEQMTVLVSHSFSGTAMPETWEPVITHCDTVAPTDARYQHIAATLVEDSSQSFCNTTGPGHKADCLRNSQQRNSQVWAQAHAENNALRQRGGRR